MMYFWSGWLAATFSSGSTELKVPTSTMSHSVSDTSSRVGSIFVVSVPNSMTLVLQP